MTDQHITRQRVKGIALAVKAPFSVTSKPHTPVTLFLWVHIDLKCKKINMSYVCMQS